MRYLVLSVVSCALLAVPCFAAEVVSDEKTCEEVATIFTSCFFSSYSGKSIGEAEKLLTPEFANEGEALSICVFAYWREEKSREKYKAKNGRDFQIGDPETFLKWLKERTYSQCMEDDSEITGVTSPNLKFDSEGQRRVNKP